MKTAHIQLERTLFHFKYIKPEKDFILHNALMTKTATYLKTSLTEPILTHVLYEGLFNVVLRPVSHLNWCLTWIIYIFLHLCGFSKVEGEKWCLLVKKIEDQALATWELNCRSTGLTHILSTFQNTEKQQHPPCKYK